MIFPRKPGLRTVDNKEATIPQITKMVHSKYSRVSMVIVRERDSTNGKEAIKKLCKGAGSTYNTITAATIDKDFAKATKNILAQQAN